MARVLILHDDGIIHQLIAEVCQSEGHEVTSVSTVQEARQVLRTSPHALVVIIEWDHIPHDQEYPLFQSRHRYVAVHAHKLTTEDEALLREIEATIFSHPFDLGAFVAVVAATREAAASLKRQE